MGYQGERNGRLHPCAQALAGFAVEFAHRAVAGASSFRAGLAGCASAIGPFGASAES